MSFPGRMNDSFTITEISALHSGTQVWKQKCGMGAPFISSSGNKFIGRELKHGTR